MDNDEKQIIASMLSLLKDYCEETQCRFCPFKLMMRTVNLL